MIFKAIRHVLASGLTATLTSTVASAVVAIGEGKGPLQPMNATSHLLYGPSAARYRAMDPDHTIVGLVTHAAATMVWASVFETALVLRPPRSRMSLVSRAASIGALAAAVDYTITPKRFTPGWELVLSKTGMAIIYAAMAAGFAGAASRRYTR